MCAVGISPDESWKCQNVVVTGDHSWRLEIGPEGGADTRFRLLSAAGESHFYPSTHPTADDFVAWVTAHTGERYGRALASRRLVDIGIQREWLSAG
jgi:hypothetical protein